MRVVSQCIAGVCLSVWRLDDTRGAVRAAVRAHGYMAHGWCCMGAAWVLCVLVRGGQAACTCLHDCVMAPGGEQQGGMGPPRHAPRGGWCHGVCPAVAPRVMHVITAVVSGSMQVHAAHGTTFGTAPLCGGVPAVRMQLVLKWCPCCVHAPCSMGSRAQGGATRE